MPWIARLIGPSCRLCGYGLSRRCSGWARGLGIGDGGTVVEFVEGVLELAEQGGVTAAQLALYVGEYF